MSALTLTSAAKIVQAAWSVQQATVGPAYAPVTSGLSFTMGPGFTLQSYSLQIVGGIVQGFVGVGATSITGTPGSNGAYPSPVLLFTAPAGYMPNLGSVATWPHTPVQMYYEWSYGPPCTGYMDGTGMVYVVGIQPGMGYNNAGNFFCWLYYPASGS